MALVECLGFGQAAEAIRGLVAIAVGVAVDGLVVIRECGGVVAASARTWAAATLFQDQHGS
ncbi:hypothetical protein [Lentzea xinjiangensis]|uniref:hypothetical protein n=1 Tax=Lentzea xinjiangensis TaxID=402600 RepID=UPI001160863F|nr:hypothetical protein [Lentzea xinjiangensis]